MNFDYAPGATPLDPDEAAGLIPDHLATMGQLNEWEAQNILQAELWLRGRRNRKLLSIAFVKQLHKRMFAETWKWAGQFRSTEKNLGIDPAHISPRTHEPTNCWKTSRHRFNSRVIRWTKWLHGFTIA